LHSQKQENMPEPTIKKYDVQRYVTGAADSRCMERVEAWMSENPQHADHVAGLKRIWAASREQAPEVDMDQAWQKFRQKHFAGPADPGHIMHMPVHQDSKFGHMFRVAALILISFSI